MAPAKKKVEDAQSVYSMIKEALVSIKSKLSEPTGLLTDQASVFDELVKLSEQAEVFLHCRSRKGKVQQDFTDDLDREGVNLWNMSGIYRPHENTDATSSLEFKLFALTRFAGLRLIEAGAEPTPEIDISIRVLQLATKTASSLVACDDMKNAAIALTSAARLEEVLRRTEATNQEQIRAKAGAIVAYYSSRMEGAWRENNEPVAFFMLTQALDDHNMSYLQPYELDLLASKVLEIGKSQLKNAISSADEGGAPGFNSLSVVKHAAVAVKWIQQALSVVERVGDNGTLGVSKLKRAVLRSLSRAYFFAAGNDPENLLRAEASITELEELLAAHPKGQNEEEYQQLCWMKLSILKKQKAAESNLVQVFRDIIDHMKFDENNVTDVLQEIRLFADSRELVGQVTHIFLGRALDSEEQTGYPYVDRILLSLIIHCKSNKDHQAALNDISTALTAISSSESFDLERTPTIACQSILFQFGGVHYQAQKFNKAAEWFILAAHPAFKAMAKSSNPKCFRKAAICYIKTGEFAKASSIMKRCPGNEAATHYVMFLSAAYQGLEEEAIDSITQMLGAPDFERDKLLLATQLAHEKKLKSLLLAVLGGLLASIDKGGNVPLQSEVEALTLVRCMIRIVLDLLKEPLAAIPKLVNTLLEHIGTARDLVAGAIEKNTAQLIVKDVSWLWRITYNAAIDGCAGWDEGKVADLFALAVELMEAYNKISLGDTKEVGQYIILALFSSVCGRIFLSRREETAEVTKGTSEKILQGLHSLRKLVTSRIRNGNEESEIERLEKIYNLTYVFEVEQLCRIASWTQLEAVIQEATTPPTTINLDAFEAMADLIWGETACPTHVLYSALEAILRCCVENGQVDCDKFSRWLRAIVTILLARGRPSDRIKALGYVEQAVDVLKDNAEDEGYPEDERSWLLSTSNNAGIDSLQVSDLDEAKRWFEAATVIVRYVQNGKQKAQQVEESYRRLLARYGDRQA